MCLDEVTLVKMGPRLGIGKGSEWNQTEEGDGTQRGEETMNEVGGRSWRAFWECAGKISLAK